MLKKIEILELGKQGVNRPRKLLFARNSKDGYIKLKAGSSDLLVLFVHE